MEVIEVIRRQFFPDRTIGDFIVKGRWFAYTLEDTDRQRQPDGSIISWSSSLKIYGKTAIPRGRYRIGFMWSNKRKGLVPHIKNVPDFTYIQIHVANSPDDLEGCIGIGLQYEPNQKLIYQSIQACQNFYPILLDLLIDEKRDVWIEIK